MAKYKVEYIKNIFRNNELCQYVAIRTIGAQHDDFFSCEDFVSENHCANSKSITLDQSCTVWFDKPLDTEHRQNLLNLYDMMMNLIKTEKPIVSIVSSGPNFHNKRELNLTPEKEQEIENIYKFAKEQEIENVDQLKKHGFFQSHKSLDEKKDNNYVAGMRL